MRGTTVCMYVCFKQIFKGRKDVIEQKKEVKLLSGAGLN